MEMLKTYQLEYKYKKEFVIKNINLSIPKGSIYGLLGKNGAGKTTIIKLILGLLPIHSKTIYYESKDFKENKVDTLKNIGNIAEAPSLYEDLTALENMKYIDYFYKCGMKRICYCLDLVGLIKNKNKKVKYFSQGMKQRLGLAIAIFHNPSVLILDEPMNGLDPEGVHEIRNLLLYLNSQGKSILLTGHILEEMNKICTHIGVLNEGALIFQGEKNELLKDNCMLVLDVDNIEKSKLLLLNYNSSISSKGELQIQIKNNDDLNTILLILLNNRIYINDIKTHSVDLESVFLLLTSIKTHDGRFIKS